MASFFGTGNGDQINPEFISDGVIADPADSLPSNADTGIFTTDNNLITVVADATGNEFIPALDVI